MLNGSALNSAAINGTADASTEDWTLSLPIERQAIYVLDVGDYRLPISSAQATMRLTGQSFLQAVVPSAGAYVDELADLAGETMTLRSGYRYADGTLSPLEDIAEAPFQISSRAQGPVADTLTISGYGTRPTAGSLSRHLVEVQTRTTGQDGRRRVRCEIDLLLRPGHLAIDTDGAAFTVGTIQYFINASSEGMEVIEHG